jgi:hypothetical protein
MDCFFAKVVVGLMPYLMIAYFTLRLLDCLLVDDMFGVYLYGAFIGLIIWNISDTNDCENDCSDLSSDDIIMTGHLSVSDDDDQQENTETTKVIRVDKIVKEVEPISLVTKTPENATQTVEVQVEPEAYVVYKEDSAKDSIPTSLGSLLAVAYNPELNSGIVRADKDGVAILKLRPVTKITYVEIRHTNRSVQDPVSALVLKEVSE